MAYRDANQEKVQNFLHNHMIDFTWILDEDNTRNKNLDLLMGMILSVQILSDLYLERIPRGKKIQLRNRTPQCELC